MAWTEMLVQSAMKVRTRKAEVYWKMRTVVKVNSLGGAALLRDLDFLVTGNGFPPGPRTTGASLSSSFLAVMMLCTAAEPMKAASMRLGYQYMSSPMKPTGSFSSAVAIASLCESPVSNARKHEGGSGITLRGPGIRTSGKELARAYTLRVALTGIRKGRGGGESAPVVHSLCPSADYAGSVALPRSFVVALEAGSQSKGHVALIEDGTGKKSPAAVVGVEDGGANTTGA